ncbi:MAG: chemotaxis response regulator protein-glutamate methylesterase [Spirochaetes bacterium]|nr:chemotaxis response regulator protein-glutamate methylesterase [Spirochaetota bacterium]
MNKTKVLIVDDSAVVRKFMTDALKDVPDIEVVGTAMDPFIAADKIKTLQPDVITLDIEMPRMDGLTFLQKLMMVRPMPVIMVSSLTDRGASETIRALEYGAIDFVLKPKAEETGKSWNDFRDKLIEKIETAKHLSIKKRKVKERTVISKNNTQSLQENSNSVYVIGASTGGTEVIEEILTSMKSDFPGIVVTQHMPPKFTEAFANRMDSFAEIFIKEASNGDRVKRGCALIAPGGMQMLLRRDSSGYFVEVNDDPPKNRHKPSVDILFSSAADSAGENATGIILTGMGADGASGLLEMKDAGADTIAQDEASCVVFGMPREAIRLGGARRIMNIESIINYMKEKG